MSIQEMKTRRDTFSCKKKKKKGITCSPIPERACIWVEALTNSKIGSTSQVKIAMAVDCKKGIKRSFSHPDTFQVSKCVG